MRNALSITPPTPVDRTNLLTLTSFTADQLGIRTLTGLEFATNLTYVEIRGNYNQPGLTNISALASLRNLTYLDVSFNQLTNAAAVAGLTNLIHLDLGGNVGANNIGIRDTAYLASLKQLQWLSLFFLGVQDLGGLTGPTALTNLNVSYNFTATNAVALNALTNLAELYATDIGLSNIDFVSRMPNLDRLDFGGNNVASLAPALGRNLVALWAYSNPLTNALLVTNFTTLGLLHLDNASLTNVSFLAGLTALHELSLDNNPGILSFSFLNALTNLTYLSVGQLPLTSVTVLSGLTNLTELHLHDDTALTSIAPLTGLTNLNNLDLNNCPLIDFTVVTNFVNLNYLQLDNDGLQAAPFVLTLPNLYSLHMNGDLCTSLDWLAGAHLGELQFSGNRLGDVSALLPMTSINYLDIRNNYLDLSPGSPAWQVITNLQALHAGQNYNAVDYSPQSVSTALTIFDQPEPQCVAVGGTGYFAIAAATTAGTLRYQWQFNDRDLPGQTNNVLWVANAASNQAGIYRVLLQDDQGGLLSARAPLYVGDPYCGQTIFIQQQPVNIVAAPGDDVTFSVSATTTLTNLYYQWQFNGTNLDGEIFSTHEIYPVTTNDVGFYRVILTDDGSNVVASAQVELRIVDLVTFPDPALSNKVYQALSLAPGTPIHLGDLDNLNSLYIGKNGNDPAITDLSGLQYARNLQSLDLSNHPITNADLLVWNSQLYYLNLDNCGLQDASFITNLFNLYDLVLSDNQIHEIPRMDGLVNTLQYLQIDRNGSLIELPRLGVLTNLVRLSLHSDSVPDVMFASQMTQLTSLDVGGDWMFDQFRNTISDISPLNGKPNLNWLSLSWDQVTNVPVVAQFTNMQHLFLSEDFFSDLSIITNMPGLVELSINYSQVTNLAVLASHWQLQTLDVSYIAASDLTPVAGLTNLNTLWAGGNHAGSASPLAALTGLRTLGYEKNGVSDLSPLAGLTNLNYVNLENNQIPGIATLAARTNLTSLYLSGNLIHDLSPLAGDTNLNWLSLSANGFTNLAPLADLTGLVYLLLQSNHIRDVTPLGGLTNLQYGLDVSANEIRDMSPLTNLHALTSLQIYQNQLTRLPSLLGLPGITGIDFWGNQLTNAAGASGMTQLTYLGLSRNNFSTIQGLSNLPNLNSLDLFTNHLTDVSGLAGLTSLHYLYLYDNDLQSIDALTNLVNLNYTDLTYNLLDTNLNSAAMMDVAILQSQNTGVNYLPQKTFSSTTITLLSPAALPGNQFWFTVQSAPGVIVRIQTSTNLVTWSPTDFVTNTTGTTSYTDTVATARQKYYRAQSQ